MASASQLVVLRLQSGGVLVVAPATALPWPRVLGRKLRRLQEYGLRMAMADPHALNRLRNELPRLLNLPVVRGALPDDDEQLATALLQGVRTGQLTLLYGNAETALRQGRADELVARYDAHPVVSARVGAVRAPGLDPAEGVPEPSTPVPHLTQDRLSWICGRTPHHLTPEVELPMREFFSPNALPVTVALLAIWSETQEADAGFTVDAGMFAAAAWELGTDADLAFTALADCFALVDRGAGWGELEKASVRLALCISTLRAPLFRQFLRRVGDRTGGQGSVGGAEERLFAGDAPSSGTGGGPAATA